MMLEQVGCLLQIRPLLALSSCAFSGSSSCGAPKAIQTKLKPEGHSLPRPTCKMRIRAGLLPGFINCNVPDGAGKTPKSGCLTQPSVKPCLYLRNAKILMTSTTSSHPWQWSNATNSLVQPYWKLCTLNGGETFEVIDCYYPSNQD